MLTFLNTSTGERRPVSDLAAALLLAQSRPLWTIADTGASPYAQGWEITLMQAPMSGTYPNVVYDVGRFDADNTVFWVPRLQQSFTLRNLLAWSNTTTTHASGGATLFPPAAAAASTTDDDEPNPDPNNWFPRTTAAVGQGTLLLGIAAIALLLLTEKK